MAEIEFNLLTEPWILVMTEDCAVKEVSLTDALLHANEYRELAGELPTQNAAILRLLLAVLHAVFERVDAEGEAAEIKTADDALDRWADLWQRKQFPKDPLLEYLETQKDNFWLFHPARPFWQIPSANRGTEYDASKLNGSLSESSNKLRLFSERNGADKRRLTYAEAARWLLYVNAFDDTSAKPTKAGKADNNGKLPSPGAGWLGKIGYVSVVGDTLYETLLLNFVLLDKDGTPWTTCTPVWELPVQRSAERTQIALPNDQAALLTLQSRRLILQRENGFVTGFYLLGGDFFEKENAFSEQMTVWGALKDGKGETVGFQPRRHNKSRQMWRDFALYAAADSKQPAPGVIHWNSLLQHHKILPKSRVLRFSIASVQYGDKDFFAADVFSDELSARLNLFSDQSSACRSLITNEILRCDKIAYYIGILAQDLFLAAGGDTQKQASSAENAKAQFYYEIDIPFRRWLASLDAEATDWDENIRAWRKQAERLAFQLAEKMERDAGPAAFVGKTVKLNQNDSGKYYSTSVAIRQFKHNMRKKQEVNQ